MATNTGKGYRKGAVKGESQVKNPVTDKWVKRGEDGKFKDVKSDGKPFKGVTKEPSKGETSNTEKKSYHVIAKSDGRWNVKKTGAVNASKSFSTKSEAVKDAANRVKKSGGGELIIHSKDGRVSRRHSYGNDSNPSEDNQTAASGTVIRIQPKGK